MSREKTDTRGRILDAAWRLLEGGGGSGVRMSDIAKAAGISRQAVYLHFPSRAELLIATTRHVDQVKDVDLRLASSRAATTGTERLEAFIMAWADYIPEVHGIAKALMAMRDTDPEARAAWEDRMRALRHGCAAAVKALERDGRLRATYNVREATDVLWTLVSIPNWELLTQDCGWSRKRYRERMTEMARTLLVAP